MTTQSFLIGPIKEGLRKDVKPFAIPEDAFEVLENAYQFRGRVIRRRGYTTLGRLGNGTPVMGLRTRELFAVDQEDLIAFDTTESYVFNGTNFIPLFSEMDVVWSGEDYQFFYSINYANGFWVTNNNPGLNGFAVTLFENQAGSGPWTVQVTAAGNNFEVGDVIYFINVTGAASPNNLRQAVVTIAGNPFTVQSTDGLGPFTDGAAGTGMALSTTRQATGQDGIRFYATTGVGNTWVNYNPPLDPDNALAGCLLMFSYKGYLLFLNTWEGNDSGILNYPNRVRWTEFGTPYYQLPVPVIPNVQGVEFTAARGDLFGRGDAFDAPTNEAIVAAGFIRDILVVYFERSTWRLRFTNNSQNPFTWERVNTELGSDCTYSSITFDKGLMTIGNRGIVISDSNDTVRFDEKIPDDIFNIRQNNHGFQRVNGIRTFKSRLLYWTFPSDSNPSGIYPDKVLVYNYDSKNWSYFLDSFTCFGYFYPSETSQTWAEMTEPWASYDNITWDSGTETQGEETIVAGNQQGYVFQLSQTGSTNDVSLSISNIVGSTVTSTNHNLQDGSWISLSGVTGTTNADGSSLNGRFYKVSNPSLDANTFGINEFKPIAAGNASGSLFMYQMDYVPIIPGSIEIDIGSSIYTDPQLDGVLYLLGLPTGTIDYNSGNVVINFSPPIVSTPVNIRVVSYNDLQIIVPVATTGAYDGGGQIITVSNFDIQTKIFNFFKDDKRSRISKIDFYVNKTQNGQFTCNIFSDSSDVAVNNPLSDNLQSNVVLTSLNPYQFGSGDETIYRLFCDAIAQTVQLQLTMSDRQIAVQAINSSGFELLSMIVAMRRGGRLV